MKLTCVLLALMLSMAGCGNKSQPAGPELPGNLPRKMKLSSPALTPGKPIAARYTGDGGDVSPALTWSNLPYGAKQLVLIMNDPDAPTATPFVHWIVYRIPPTINGLPEGLPRKASLPDGLMQGKNSFGKTGYDGPIPPPGQVHRYVFRLYALNQPLELGPNQIEDAITTAMSGHILDVAEIMVTYKRP